MKNDNRKDELSRPWLMVSNAIPPIGFSCISVTGGNFRTKPGKR
ncbi:MAG TPA: hypothetical protein VL098_05760 [Flavipsychrobacter sp.]|nr:hypothetical protein [Flavipsychrobacter sp.]